MSSLLRAENLGKVYPLPKGELQVFRGLNFELEAGDIVAVMGIALGVQIRRRTGETIKVTSDG